MMRLCLEDPGPLWSVAGQPGYEVVVEGGFLFDVVEDHADEWVALEFAARLLEVAPTVAFGGGVEAEADV